LFLNLVVRNIIYVWIFSYNYEQFKVGKPKTKSTNFIVLTSNTSNYLSILKITKSFI